MDEDRDVTGGPWRVANKKLALAETRPGGSRLDVVALKQDAVRNHNCVRSQTAQYPSPCRDTP